jgi:hypothetical protein
MPLLAGFCGASVRLGVDAIANVLVSAQFPQVNLLLTEEEGHL